MKYGHLFFPIQSNMKFSLSACLAGAAYTQGIIYESDSPEAVHCPLGRTALQVPFTTFQRSMPANALAQLPEDVQILSVGFYSNGL